MAGVTLAISFVVLALAVVGLGELITHVLVHGRVGSGERRFQAWLIQDGTRTWSRLSWFGTLLGDTFVVAGVAGFVTILLLARHWGVRAALLVIGLALELAVFLTANYVVARPRPTTVRHLGLTPSTYSFPSGHTAAAVVLYGGIALIVSIAVTSRLARVAVWAVAALIVVSVGLSRIYRGDHFLTDVIAGLLLGVAALSVAIFVVKAVVAAREGRASSRAAVQGSDPKLARSGSK